MFYQPPPALVIKNTFASWIKVHPFSFNDFEVESCESKPMSSKPSEVQTLGVAQGCNRHSILDAIASLLEARRPDLVLVLIEQELNSQT